MCFYTTRKETIEREIVVALGEYADDYDIDAIADVVIESGPIPGCGTHAYYVSVAPEDFWEVVEEHAKILSP